MENALHLARYSLVITQKCTLQCKLCAEYSPYVDNPETMDFEEIKKEIDRSFAIIDSIGDFSFSGGEPLLNANIYQAISYASKYFDRIDNLLVLTNGTLVPSEEKLAKIMEENPKIIEKLQFNVSNYGPNISKRVGDIEKVCEKLKIKCRVIKYYGEDLWCNGWIDFGDHSKKYFSEEETRAHAQTCNYRKNVFFPIHYFNGKTVLARCSRSFWRNVWGITPEKSKDLIFLPDEVTPRDVVEYRQKIREMLDMEYTDSCAYCNGMCEDSPRCKPAEQLTNKELKDIKCRLAEVGKNG